MDGQEGEAVARIPKVNDNQIINQLQTISRKLTGFGTKFRELDNRYLNWVSKQSFPVQATVVATSSAIHGAAFGGLLGAVGQVAWHVFPKHSLPFKAFCPSPMVEARTFAAMWSTYASVTFIMKRIRGEEDVQTRMAADFVSGAMCRLVTRMGDPYVAVDAVVVGTICALVGGTVFQPPNRQPQQRPRANNKQPQGPCQICMRRNHAAARCWYRFDKNFVPQQRAPAAAYIALPQGQGDNSWVTDTGETHHLTTDINNLSIPHEYEGTEQVQVGNGNALTIANIGKSSFTYNARTFPLNNIYHVPAIQRNLLSVHQFCKDNDVFFEFHTNLFIVKDKSTGTTLLQGRNKNWLYVFDNVGAAVSQIQPKTFISSMAPVTWSPYDPYCLSSH